MTVNRRTESISAIRALPAALEKAVRGLSEPQLDTPYRQGGWSVRQVTHHLADSHLNAFLRTKLILTEPHPTLKPYDQDVWAALEDSRVGLDSSLMILRGLHDRWAVLLAGLPEPAWVRAGFHPERGDITVEAIAEIYAAHGRKHVDQILGLRQSRGW